MRLHSFCSYLLVCLIGFVPALLPAQESAAPVATPNRLSLEMATEILMARNPDVAA